MYDFNIFEPWPENAKYELSNLLPDGEPLIRLVWTNNRGTVIHYIYSYVVLPQGH